ncbi:hypothetical protein PRUPE_3G037100 [Prunus persica]|uniref:FMN hydroxy acid dehydrogenase domain-containing protein n=1 Tax=Prunus persica TaxID=3760 RepID=A0A251PUT4_PRUPE|nr:hypothetical protein PRUPE_3G037100 [Prunus persica]
MATEPGNVNEFRELARLVLPKMYYDFYTGGAEDQHTLKQNVDAFRRFVLQPRVLVDVSKIDMSTTVLGYKISAPIRLLLQLGIREVATARAAAACNTIMVLSNMSTCTVEDVASSCNAVRFFQLYFFFTGIFLVYSFFSFCHAYWGLKLSNGTFPEQVYKRRDISAQIVQRAEKSGYKAIVLTVDAPRLGRREADIKNDEFELTMALCGCPGVMDITRSHVRTECDKLHSML